MLIQYVQTFGNGKVCSLFSRNVNEKKKSENLFNTEDFAFCLHDLPQPQETHLFNEQAIFLKGFGFS